MKTVLRILGVIVLVATLLGTGYFLYQKSVQKEAIYKKEAPFVTTIINKTVATGAVVPTLPPRRSVGYRVCLKSRFEAVAPTLPFYRPPLQGLPIC